MFPLRDENPRARFPFFTVVIIALNVFVFGYEVSLGEMAVDFVKEYGAIPVEVLNSENLPGSRAISPIISLASSLFIHGGIGHLVSNMWFLWLFGDNIESEFGVLRFLILYFVAGVCASLSHAFLNPNSSMPVIGASGAISGILGSYVVRYPKVKIRTLVFFGFWVEVVRIPAVFFLGIWFLMQVAGVFDQGRSPIAFAAHAGGFLVGFVLTVIDKKRKAGG